MRNTFLISRLVTPFGIFRVSGHYDNKKDLEIINLDVMGTDGWVLFNKDFDKKEELYLHIKEFLSTNDEF
ncbi:hypothetical protein L1077_10790 [Pseudoalteromonas luteoviolacea]|uniref:hypothetical protein n=1 Tax=Pseudoalteromonas luteoviolacea TaxID=43657 RepID=UPI001F22388E|nr:hypothetical protein [Pseudoalteromonas luteoviolacea]MCF6439919.1 hypothetical protein [Pseudoalteromonas luteoviolacea]